MKKKDFNKIKEGFKEASDLLKGKKVPGTTMDIIDVRQKNKPMKIIDTHISPLQIKELRNKLKLSQNDFAKVLGVSPNAVKSWEQGRRIPNNSIFHLMKLLADNHKRINELTKVN